MTARLDVPPTPIAEPLISPVVIETRDLSKRYHLWKSPQDRLMYGFWSQVPSWAPRFVREFAGERKNRISQDFIALRDISIQVRRGESVAIIGRNGSGKSTLLQIIAGVLQPSSGQFSVSTARITALLELGSGFNPDFSGRENIELNAAILGFSAKHLKSKIEEIIRFADVGDFIDQPVIKFSTGMALRVAFSVSVFLEPDILIVDEALAVGDAPFQAKCFRKIKELQSRGTSLLFTSHDMAAVRALCSRAVWLDQGKVRSQGAVEDVVREYELMCWEQQGIRVKGDPGESALSSDRTEAELTSRQSNFACPEYLLAENTAFKKLSEIHRFGVGSLRVLNAQLTDNDDQPQTLFEYSQECRIHLLLNATEPLSGHLLIGAQIKNPKGTAILTLDPAEHVETVQIDSGQLLCASSHFPATLAAGKYLVTVGIYGFKDGDAYEYGCFDFNRAIVYDFIEAVAAFEVIPTRGGLAGPVHLDRKFRLDKLDRAAFTGTSPQG